MRFQYSVFIASMLLLLGGCFFEKDPWENVSVEVEEPRVEDSLSQKIPPEGELLSDETSESPEASDQKVEHTVCASGLTEKNEPRDPEQVQRIVQTLEEAFTDDFASGEIVFLDREKIYFALDSCDASFVEELFHIDPTPWGIRFPRLPEEDFSRADFTALDAAPVTHSKNAIQYAPHHIAAAYTQMMTAMKEEIGRQLYVESGYRSPYFQAYTFLSYYKKFKSFAAVAKYVALPGRSEHGAFQLGALDFITADGISDNNVSVFIDRAEYDWLEQNAMRFGFFETFEVANRYGYGFEPWHWHYEPAPKRIGDLRQPYGLRRLRAQTEWGNFIETLPLKPLGNRTMLLFRRENRSGTGEVFINSFTNYVYENIIQTMAVVDIPVSAWQDCSKQIIRLLALYAEKKNISEEFSFPRDGKWRSFSDFIAENPEASFEDFIKDIMLFTGTVSWRVLLPKIPESEVQIGDLIIQPQVSMAVDPIYGEGAVIGHTAIISGISEDTDGHRYYLITSGSLPVTSLRVSKANNGWQGWAGWFDLEGYKHRTKASSIEFYRMQDFAEKVLGN